MTQRNRDDNLTRVMGREFALQAHTDDRLRSSVPARSILWQSGGPSALVEHADRLLVNRRGQITVGATNCCLLHNRGGRAGLLLDFGVELHGGVRILAHSVENDCRSFRLRVRFGESAMEAMSELGGPTNATNDHAIRDTLVDVSAMGSTEVGGTGFRFVRIDLVEDGSIALEEVTAIFTHRDITYRGSFESNDELLNRIWNTAAYTVYLNMQNYLWDGIKRDRIVWVGDMHPETSSIQAVFGYDPVVPKSLDFVRDTTPLPGHDQPRWMNGLPSYSMWWVLIQHSWYRHNGDHDYLLQQKPYLLELLRLLAAAVDPAGRSRPQGSVFLDWPSAANPRAAKAGVQALHAMSMEAGAALCRHLGEPTLANGYGEVAARLRGHTMDHGGSKQAAAMLALAQVRDAASINRDVLAVGGARGMSSFLGYYILQARALAGDIQGCLDNIREYWGGMLSLGATSFWEDFDVEWLRNAARIDELTPVGLVDVHGTYGSNCYTGYRHSLCHGWSSGPAAWLSEHVLGVQPAEPGCGSVHIQPQLGDLQWVRGTYPTPHGLIRLDHRRGADGSISSEIDLPPGVKLV